MNVITRKDLAKDAAELWRNQYQVAPFDWVHPSGMDAVQIYQDLRSLVDPTPEQVNAIIGNPSWTYLKCNECGVEVDAVVCFEDYDNVIYLCKKCLKKARKLL